MTLVSGPTELASPPGVETVRVLTAEEMLAACRQAFVDVRIVVAAAAVADFRPAHRARGKAKKADMSLKLELERTPDILAELAANKGDRFLVGFAAETENVVDGAQSKLQRKKLDLIVANDVGQAGLGFASERNKVLVISPEGSVTALGPAPKTQIAAGIWDLIAGLWER